MTNDKENEGVKEHPFLSFFFGWQNNKIWIIKLSINSRIFIDIISVHRLL